jgi:chromosome segregation ATPase
MINENYNNFHSDEKILYEIVEIILKSQDKIDLLKNNLKIIKEKNIQKSNKKTFDLKFNITKNLSKINELSNELNYKKKFLEEIQINTKNQIENLDLEYKNIKDKLNNLNLNKKELDEDEIEKLINLKKDNENLKSFSIEYSNVENQINNYKNKIKENENNYFLIENNLNMLKEEKKTIKFNIINLISEKESLEEIINNFFGQKINKKNFFYYLNNNIEFYVYELKNLDMNLLCNELAVNLINFMIYNNLIMNFDTEDINLKYDLSFFLKNEILNFLNNKKELLTFFYFNNFIENLSKKIISTFELNYDSNKLANFLLYVIKLNYLNKLIDFNLIFI